MSEKTVLIIDDDTLLCWVLSRRFSLMGINAVSASNGSEGLIKVKQQAFDIIFIDINLPDINGLELLDKIQELSLLSKLIVITAETSEDYRQDAINKGAFDFIEKPFGFSEIKKVVNSIFSDRREERECQRFTCDIPCSVFVLKKPDADQKEISHNDYLPGTVVDISKKGLELKFEKGFTDITKGKFIRLLTDMRDNRSFDFLSSNIVVEIVWVKPRGREIFAGVKYL